MEICSIACATSRKMHAAMPATRYKLQKGLDPTDWKPMPTIGAGVREIRIRQTAGFYRVIYIATLADVVHVLHAFRKTSQKAARRDLDLAAARLLQLKRGSK